MARTKTGNSKKKTIFVNIWFWLVVALLVRLSLAFWQYSGDLRNHLAWGEGVLTYGNHFFEASFPGFNTPNYPPLALYFFAAGAFIYKLIVSLFLWLNQALAVFPSALVWATNSLNFQLIFIKLPPMLADIGIGWLIYRLLGKNQGLSAALLFLFNPAVIYVSTIWGQIESIPIFFLLVSTLGLKDKKFLVMNLGFVAAVLSKQTALWLAPFFLIGAWQQFGTIKLGIGISLQAIVANLSLWPLGLVGRQPLSWFLSTLSGSSTLVSDAAWNIWYFVSGPTVSDATLLGPISLRVWSLLLLGVSSSLLLYYQLKSKVNIFTVLFFASLLAFFLQTRVHERHLFPAVAFLLLVPISARTKLLAYASLSAFFLANLTWSLKLPFV